MLNDEDAINDVNPFVTHDFSLPGGMRQTGEFENFSERDMPTIIGPIQNKIGQLIPRYCLHLVLAPGTMKLKLFFSLLVQVHYIFFDKIHWGL